jgi:hypothetical protein
VFPPSDRNQVSPAKKGSSIQVSPTRRWGFIFPRESPGKTFQMHNSFITSFHSIRMHTLFAFIFISIKYLMHHDMAWS